MKIFNYNTKRWGIYISLLLSVHSYANISLDSLHIFLHYINEEHIINYIDTNADYEDIINTYLNCPIKLEYDNRTKRLEWESRDDNDSIMYEKIAQYAIEQIVRDTALFLINEYLEPAYFVHRGKIQQMITECAIELIKLYNARDALLILEIEFYNRYNNSRSFESECLYVYYSIIKLILTGRSYPLSWYFDEKWNNFLRYKDVDYPTNYKSFRTLLKNTSDTELISISENYKGKLLQHTLKKGIYEGETECILIYALMQITGCIVEYDHEAGLKLLETIPDIKEYPIWNILTDSVFIDVSSK